MVKHTIVGKYFVNIGVLLPKFVPVSYLGYGYSGCRVSRTIRRGRILSKGDTHCMLKFHGHNKFNIVKLDEVSDWDFYDTKKEMLEKSNYYIELENKETEEEAKMSGKVIRIQNEREDKAKDRCKFIKSLKIPRAILVVAIIYVIYIITSIGNIVHIAPNF